MRCLTNLLERTEKLQSLRKNLRLQTKTIGEMQPAVTEMASVLESSLWDDTDWVGWSNKHPEAGGEGQVPNKKWDLSKGSELNYVVDILKPLGLLLFQQSFAERTIITLLLFGAVCKLYNTGNNLAKFGLCVWTQDSQAMTLLWEVVGPWGGGTSQ